MPSELNAAYLYSQLEIADEISKSRMHAWELYNEGFKSLSDSGRIDLPYVPEDCKHNAHMYYIKLKDLDERTELIKHLRRNNINAVFHYVPLHSAPAGMEYGVFVGEDKYTTKESERILRMPMYDGIKDIDIEYIVEKVYEFFGGE